jgi:hypothetical protein
MIAEIGSGGSLFDYQSAAQWFPFSLSETPDQGGEFQTSIFGDFITSIDTIWRVSVPGRGF